MLSQVRPLLISTASALRPTTTISWCLFSHSHPRPLPAAHTTNPAAPPPGTRQRRPRGGNAKAVREASMCQLNPAHGPCPGPVSPTPRTMATRGSEMHTFKLNRISNVRFLSLTRHEVSSARSRSHMSVWHHRGQHRSGVFPAAQTAPSDSMMLGPSAPSPRAAGSCSYCTSPLQQHTPTEALSDPRPKHSPYFLSLEPDEFVQPSVNLQLRARLSNACVFY